MELDYNNLTHDEEVEILSEIIKEEGSNILTIDNIYSILREHFNNEILRRYERRIRYPDSTK